MIAAYRGDTLLAIADSKEEIAKKLNMKLKNIKWMSSPTAFNRDNNYNRVLIYDYYLYDYSFYEQFNRNK